MSWEADTAARVDLRARSVAPAGAGTGTPASSDPGHSVALPGWVRVILAVALVKVVAAIAAVAIPGPEDTPPAAYVAAVCVFAISGAWLMTFGRRDRRAISLGIFFLLVASSFTGRLFLSAADAAPALAPALRFLTRATVEAYQPFFFWLFVRDFPRTRRVVRARRVVRWMAAATFWTGTILLLANLSLAFETPGRNAIERWLGRGSASLYWLILFVPMLLAVAHAVSQARRASPDERRRVRIMMAGLVAGVAPIIAVSLASFLVPTFGRYVQEHRAEAVRTLGLVVYPALLSIPIVTTYTVVVHRALDLRQIVRRALRYGLARYTLAAITAAPLVIVLGALYARREESLQSLIQGPTGLLLAATLAAGAAMLAFRRRALTLLDRGFFREQYDAQLILTDLVEEARAARTPEELAQVLERDIDRALHLRSVGTLFLDDASATLVAPRATLPPLSLGTPLARAIEAVAAPLEIDWERPDEWLAALPEASQRWLSDSDLRLLVPVTARDGSLIGALALGEKRSELPFTAEDRRLLVAIAGSVALWLESRLPGAGGAVVGEGGEAAPAASARECEACGVVCAAATAECPRCGGATRTAPVPLILGGKFTLLERIGSGGMGVVYRAADLALHRVVAIKTLPRVSPREAARLREEARAMAAVLHPNLAAIHAAEAWNGIPMLVVEYLPGGTLDARLAGGPLPPAEMVSVAAELALALARLHDAGVLHRDVKPSNIGFAMDGTPKLLDFGVARVLEAAREAAAPPVEWLTAATPAPTATDPAEWGGTPLYLSPEAVMGHRPDVSFDLWALCMVLYESVAGRHPFADDPPAQALLRIYDAAVPDASALAPHTPPPLAAFLREALHADIRRRPASARELHQRLAALR